MATSFQAVADALQWSDMTVAPATSHPSSFPAWKEKTEEAISELMTTSEIAMTRKEEESFEVAKQVGFSLMEKFLTRATAAGWGSQEPAERRAHLEHLLTLPQIPQRTPAWYAQGKEVLTASEFGTLFGSPRAVGQLVMSKVPAAAAAAPAPTNRLACMTCEMGPFDWGIRFEPVVKQYLERIWGTRIVDSGRLLHPTDPHLAASPDGLIMEANDPRRVGRLIEIKCPITRAIGEGVPFDYWCQMQVQMEVTGVDECDYVEVKVASIQKHETDLSGNAPADGTLWLFQDPQTTTMAYAYTETEKGERAAAGWDLVETIPWRIAGLWTKTVPRDRAWFRGTEELRKAFWANVEAARAGTFTAPESSRPRAPAKQVVIVQKEDAAPPTTCLFLDE